MRTPPAFATRILLCLGLDDESFRGDLIEEYESGRSRTWYWRQVLSAVVAASVRHATVYPISTLMAVITGWSTLLLAFSLGDRTAYGVAGLLWNWSRETAYSTQVWWPFQITAAFVSYVGFALSSIVVVLFSRRRSALPLVAYATSVFLVLAGTAVLIEILSMRHGRVPVPHVLFYIVSVSLPYQWWSGLLLAPAVILTVGLLARRPLTAPAPATERDLP